VVNVLAGTTILTANNDYGAGTNIFSAGTLVVGVPSSSQETSLALGVGDVSVQGGTLRTTSLLTGPSGIVIGMPLTINVGGSYTQKGETLLLGIGGTQGERH
jgi:hypothetical protein